MAPCVEKLKKRQNPIMGSQAADKVVRKIFQVPAKPGLLK
jgi:hypothetical protein